MENDGATQRVRPELPQRLRRSKMLRVVLWVLAVLVIGFLFLAQTRTYRLYHHRSALRTLGQSFFTPRLTDWRDYLTPQAVFWVLHYKLSLDDKMRKAQEHQQALIEMGYLERRVFKMHHPLDRLKDVTFQIRQYDPTMWTSETSAMIDNGNLVVVAPAATMPQWDRAVAQFEADRKREDQAPR